MRLLPSRQSWAVDDIIHCLFFIRKANRTVSGNLAVRSVLTSRGTRRPVAMIGYGQKRREKAALFPAWHGGVS